jgi:hypothetical protein
MSAPTTIGWQFNYLALFHSVWGWAWLPLLMMYVRRVMQERPYSVVCCALALAALIMTSTPITIIFGPMAVAYSALYFRKDKLARQSAMIGIALLLGFGLAAIFLIPAASYLDYSGVKRFWTDATIDYHYYFVTLGFGSPSQTMFTSGIFAITLLTLLYCVAIRDRSKHYFFFAVAIFASLFMILHTSQWVWKIIPVLKMIQYPQRFFMVPSLCLAVLASVAMPRLRWLAYVLIILYAASNFMLAIMDTRITEEGLRKYKHFIYEQYVLGVDFAGLLTSPDLAPQFAKNLAALDKPHDKVTVIDGNAVAKVTKWQPRDIELHYTARKPSVLRIWQFYFPGFMAFQGNKMLDTGRDEHTGQIVISIPPGEGDVRLELTQLMPEVAGKMISLLCAGIVLLWFLAEFRRREKTTRGLKHP